MDSPVKVPAGHIHRSGILERGWTSAMVTAHLPQFATVDAPVGTSNKAYSVAEVERVEREVSEVARAVAARAALVPRGGPYDHDSTVARSTLLSRGWTAAHIKRLLGDPDWTEMHQSDRTAYRYGKDRVETAETTDTALRRRLTHATQTRDDHKAAQIAETIADGTGVWRRIDGRWLVQGIDLVTGQDVQVRTKDGRTQTKIVTGVVQTSEDGTRLVEVTDPRPVVAPRLLDLEESHLFDRSVQIGVKTWEALVDYSLNAGNVTRLPGSDRWVMVVSARAHTIEEDDPSVFGGHLLSSEGMRGTMAVVRDATDDEAAPHQEAARTAAARLEARVAQQAAVRALVDHITAHGTKPRPEDHQIAGHSVYDDRTIVGTGQALLVEGARVTLIESNGMDGDNWAHNNYPGSIVTVCDDVPTGLTEALRRTTERNESL